MEMLVVKTLLGDESEATKTALAGSALHLVKLGVLEGEIPQWGDWDEGRVLASSGSALDLAGSTAPALSISGEATENGWPKAFRSEEGREGKEGVSTGRYWVCR